MHVHRNTRLQVRTRDLSNSLLGRDGNHLLQHTIRLLERLIHNRLVSLRVHQTILHIRRPQKLNSEQRDLRRVREDKLLKRHVRHAGIGLLNNTLDCGLHTIHKVLQPHLNVTHCKHRVIVHVSVGIHFNELHALSLDTEHLKHLRLVNLIECDRSHGVKQTGLEVRLHRMRVRTQGQNLEQCGIRHKVETGELRTLRVQERRQRLLAKLQLLSQVRKQVLHQLVVVTSRNHIRGFNRIRHNLHVVLVNILETLRLLRQLLDNVTSAEHRLHVTPHILHNQPHLNNLRNRGQLHNPLLHFLAERSGVPIRRHGTQSHLRVLKLLHNLSGISRRQQHIPAMLVWSKCKVAVSPVLSNCRKLHLNLLFLHRRRRQLLKLLIVRKKISIQQLLELEDILRKTKG
mmetsp:Transcript_10932/g.12861  ORF Transcript_10932/g.12861 Transcript_10932/m.12861 type:complete len:401 (-) Transcript_10932:3355-4557(-)